MILGNMFGIFFLVFRLIKHFMLSLMDMVLIEVIDMLYNEILYKSKIL